MIVVEKNSKFIKSKCALTDEVFDLEDYVFTINGGETICESNIKDSQIIGVSKSLLMDLIKAKRNKY